MTSLAHSRVDTTTAVHAPRLAGTELAYVDGRAVVVRRNGCSATDDGCNKCRNTRKNQASKRNANPHHTERLYP